MVKNNTPALDEVYRVSKVFEERLSSSCMGRGGASADLMDSE